MNNSLLLLLVVLLFCITNKPINRFHDINKRKKKVRFGQATVLNREDFYGNYNKTEDYSVDDDYYIDKMGTKGYMFNKTSAKDIYDCSDLKKREKKEENNYENYDNIINKLEIYNRKFYDNCVSDYNPSELKPPPMYNDPIKDRLRFNQGILFSTSDQIKMGL